MSIPAAPVSVQVEAQAPVVSTLHAPAAPVAPATPVAPPVPAALAALVPSADSIFRSVVRTVVPVVVGILVALAIKAGYHVDPNGPVSAEVTTVVTAGYYAGVRFLEVHVSPKFGWLLGAAGAPKYAA